MTGQLRILVLIGSPRSEESWTYRVIRQIERKMNDLQPTAFEYVFLGKLQVPYCDGCLSCVRVGEESCPEFATIGPIAARMDAADGLVLGAPVHTFAVTGLMKNFVEYFMYKRNRPSFFGKKAIVTCAASGGGHRGVLDFLEGTASAWGCDVVTRLGISSSQMHKKRYLQLIDECTSDVAEKFVAAIRAGAYQQVTLNQLVNFRAMQNMTRSQPDTKNYAYWQERGWLEAVYYTDAPTSHWARFMAGYVARRMRGAIRKGNIRPFR
ncbi:MAG: NAD(P)H-dependent oxidoreductase [Gammaproteobacteria bacterium]|nr:NAD(P)H-dependent oxidoreductase [Gammaproteobacteria bacterium]